MGEFLELAASKLGRIKFYSLQKSFGFVTADDGSEVFFHHGSIVYSGPGHCSHNRGICARAMSLLSEDKQREAKFREAGHHFNERKFEMMLEGEKVMFRLFQSPRGLEARSVRRAI